MKKAPSTLTAMISLAVFLCLGMNNVSQGQTDCSECICLSDNTCANAECTEITTANCARREFTVTCNGDYDIYSAITSCGDACGKCNSCVNVFKLSNGVEEEIGNCHTVNCNTGTCEYNCTESVTLNTGTTYVLYVCKLFCPQYASDCDDCGTSCVAIGCVGIGHASMPCTTP